MANDILHDIDETLRQERLAALWKEWRLPFVIGLVVALCTIVGISLWRDYQAQAAASAVTTFFEGIRGGENSEAKFTAVAQSAHPTYRAMARLQLASLQPGQAQEHLRAILDDGRVPEELHHLAQLQLGERLMDEQPDEAKKLLQGLVDDDSAFNNMALELLGTLAENQKDTLAARTYYSQILELENPLESQVKRVQARLDALSQ